MLNSEFVADLFVYVVPSVCISGASAEQDFCVRNLRGVSRWIRLEPSLPPAPTKQKGVGVSSLKAPHGWSRETPLPFSDSSLSPSVSVAHRLHFSVQN